MEPANARGAQIACACNAAPPQPGAGLAVNTTVAGHGGFCVCVCARARVRACARACVRACGPGCVHVLYCAVAARYGGRATMLGANPPTLFARAASVPIGGGPCPVQGAILNQCQPPSIHTHNSVQT
jgi:hypothetical protein